MADSVIRKQTHVGSTVCGGPDGWIVMVSTYKNDANDGVYIRDGQRETVGGSKNKIKEPSQKKRKPEICRQCVTESGIILLTS